MRIRTTILGRPLFLDICKANGFYSCEATLPFLIEWKLTWEPRGFTELTWNRSPAVDWRSEDY